MKIFILKIWLFIKIWFIVFALAGCALYGNEAQYAEGDWYWITDSTEIANIKKDKMNQEMKKLALEKLKNQPADVKTENGVFQGYRGVLKNASSYETINIKIGVNANAPEYKSYLLTPGQMVYDYLLPADYIVCAMPNYSNYEIKKCDKVPVNTRKHFFGETGEYVHWYIRYSDR